MRNPDRRCVDTLTGVLPSRGDDGRPGKTRDVRSRRVLRQDPHRDDPLLVCVLDRDGRILLFNEACERATGYRRDEVLGRDARDLVIPPREREAFGEFLTFVWRTGSPSPQVGHWQTKQGRLRLIAWSNHPMPGPGRRARRAGHDGHRPDRPREPEPGRGGRAGGRPRRQARGDRPAGHGAAGAAPGRHARRVRGQPGARVHRGLRGLRARARGQRLDRRALRKQAGTATVHGRHNRDNIDVFRVGERIRADPDSALARVRATVAPGAYGRLGRPRRRDRRRDVPHGLPLDGRRPRSSSRVRCGARSRSPARTRSRPTPRTGSGRSWSSPRLRWPAPQARADLTASRARVVKGGRSAAPPARAQPARRRAAAARLRRADAAARQGARGWAPCGDAAAKLLDDASRELDTGLAELRELARGLHPAVLGDHGLQRAIEALDRSAPAPRGPRDRARRAPARRTSRRRPTTSSRRRSPTWPATRRRTPPRVVVPPRRRRAAGRDLRRRRRRRGRLRAARASSACATRRRPRAARSRSAARPGAGPS